MSEVAEYNQPSTSAAALADIYVQPSTSAAAFAEENCVNQVVCLSSDESDLEIVEEEDRLQSSNKEPSTFTRLTGIDVSGLLLSVKKNPHLKCLFKNQLMEPLTFVFLLHDFPLEMKLKQLAEEYGGVIYDSVRDIDSYTIVLVKDESLHWAYLGPAFKMSYLLDCIRAKRILDISSYFRSSQKYEFNSNFNYMSVVYDKKYTWDSVPEEFLICNKTTASPAKALITQNKSPVGSGAASENSLSESEDINEEEGPTTEMVNQVKAPKQINKHTRMFYSRTEDECIVKYIVKKSAYGSVKGVALWRKMESRNVCPIRTWQSMKNRFIKKIVFELRSYKFLNKTQLQRLEECLL